MRPLPVRPEILDPQGEPRLARFLRRVRRHWSWARTQGIGRLVEEGDLHPLSRARLAVQRRRWQSAHPISPGTAIPVYLVGLQRSGTNMLAKGLEASLEFEVRNENDRRAFSRFLLRPDAVLQDLVKQSPARYILFKPLCDAHRVGSLLDGLATASPGRAVWMYRGVDGRLASAVAKFGDVSRQVVRAIADGTAGGAWQAQGISEANLELVRSFDAASMSPESAAGLFWYLRNSLYFDLGLDRRPDVVLVSWDQLVRAPEALMGRLCRFLGLDLRRQMIAHMEMRGDIGRPSVEIDPRIRARCADLQSRLDEIATIGAADPGPS